MLNFAKYREYVLKAKDKCVKKMFRFCSVNEHVLRSIVITNQTKQRYMRFL